MERDQFWCEMDLGFFATREKLLRSERLIGDMQSYRGILTFSFKNLKDVTIQITTRGKVSLTAPKGMDLFKVFLEELKPYLVKPDGSPARIIRIIKKPQSYRALAGKPPLDPRLLSTETIPLWKKQAIEDFLKIRNAEVNDDPDDIVQVPYATIRVLDSYPKLKENMIPDYNKLVRKFNQAYKNLPIDPFPRENELRRRLREIAHELVPAIYEKAFRFLHES